MPFALDQHPTPKTGPSGPTGSTVKNPSQAPSQACWGKRCQRQAHQNPRAQNASATRAHPAAKTSPSSGDLDIEVPINITCSSAAENGYCSSASAQGVVSARGAYCAPNRRKTTGTSQTLSPQQRWLSRRPWGSQSHPKAFQIPQIGLQSRRLPLN